VWQLHSTEADFDATNSTRAAPPSTPTLILTPLGPIGACIRARRWYPSTPARA